MEEQKRLQQLIDALRKEIERLRRENEELRKRVINVWGEA